MEIMDDDTGLDGMFGTLLAVHGVFDYGIVFHGPDGCRKYFRNVITSLNTDVPQVMDPDPNDVTQARLFGTSMDCSDYLSDSLVKVRRTLAGIREFTDRPLVIVPSPGTLLLGIDYENIGEGYGDVFAVEGSYGSLGFEEAFDETMYQILGRELTLVPEKVPDTVNILGFPPSARGKSAFIAEIKDMLELVGIGVTCCIGMDSLENHKRSATACVNVVVSREYCRKTSALYEGRLGIHSLSMECAPVGFEAVQKFYLAICERFGKDPTPILERIGAMRRHAYHCIQRMWRDDGLSGIGYSVCGDYSVIRPIVDWLYSSFGMVPTSVCPNQMPDGCTLEGLLEGMGCLGSLDSPIGEGDGLIITDRFYGKIQSLSRVCLPLNGLVSGQPDVIVRTVFGVVGCAYIIDTLLNLL